MENKDLHHPVESMLHSGDGNFAIDSFMPLEALCSQLTTPVYDSLLAEGRGLTISEAVKYALASPAIENNLSDKS